MPAKVQDHDLVMNLVELALFRPPRGVPGQFANCLRRGFRIVFPLASTVVWIFSATGPANRKDWCTENMLAIFAIGFVLFLRLRSHAAYEQLKATRQDLVLLRVVISGARTGEEQDWPKPVPPIPTSLRSTAPETYLGSPNAVSRILWSSSVTPGSTQ